MNQQPHVDNTAPTRPIDWTQALFSYPVRLAVYLILVVVVCQIVLAAIRQHGITIAADENGPVEKAQVGFALFTSACLFFAAARIRVGRTLLTICACMVGYAAARECDVWFETVLFEDAYKYLAGLPLLGIALSALFRGRKQIFHEVMTLTRTPTVTIFAFAGVYICCVCQVIERPVLWAAVGTGDEAILTRAAIEEFAELFGYLLLAFSGVESVAMALASCESRATVQDPSPLGTPALCSE
jgi:hypothetical protein